MASYWLFKSEPETYSIDHLQRDKRTFWDGVRNYQARNLLRDQIKLGDEVLFYHSVVKPMAVVGIAKVVKEGAPDPSQFDRKSKYYDADASPDDPRWYGVEIAFARKLDRPVTLEELKATKGIEDMVLLNRSRLSVQPVTAKQFQVVMKLAGER